MDEAERRVAEYLGGLGLTNRPFGKAARRSGRTPDFRIHEGFRLRFYCEVESTHCPGDGNTGLDEGCLTVYEASSLRKRICDRLATHVHTAVKQFDAVNPGARVPNVLALFNDDPRCRFDDIVAAVTAWTHLPD